jgi:hypothetical protein
MRFSTALLCAAAAAAAAPAGPAGPWDAALYMHSDATAASLNARCLDGSKGALYYRPASSPSARTKWKFHFMGGGWATTPESLLARSRGVTGSSAAWTPWLSSCLGPEYAGFYGLMSLNATRDAAVGDFNFVCSYATPRLPAAPATA